MCNFNFNCKSCCQSNPSLYLECYCDNSCCQEVEYDFSTNHTPTEIDISEDFPVELLGIDPDSLVF